MVQGRCFMQRVPLASRGVQHRARAQPAFVGCWFHVECGGKVVIGMSGVTSPFMTSLKYAFVSLAMNCSALYCLRAGVTPFPLHFLQDN